MKLKSYGPILIAVAAILWALDAVLRRSLYVLDPSVIVFFEHLIGAIIIAPFTLVALKKEKITRRDMGALTWVAALSGVVGTLLFTAALIKVNYISISVVFLLQKLQPIFAIAAAAIVLKERITLKYVGWAALALVAAFFVTFNNGVVNWATGSETSIAALMAVGAAFAWGSSTAVSRYALLDISNTLATGLRFFITVPLALLTVFLLGAGKGLTTVTGDQMLTLIAIALSTGMVALWIYYKGLKTTEVRVATILELLFPVTAVFVDVYYYHTVLSVTQYLAAVVLLFAAYKVSQLNRVKA